jgi:hypothetical protein
MQPAPMKKDASFRFQSEITKVDEALGLVLGWGIICKDGGEEYFDLQEDSSTEGALVEAALDFMLHSRVAKEMHRGRARGAIVFCWPMTTDIAKAFGFETSGKTGLLVGMRPDSAMLEKFKTGELTGFSMGGRCLESEPVEVG